MDKETKRLIIFFSAIAIVILSAILWFYICIRPINITIETLNIAASRAKANDTHSCTLELTDFWGTPIELIRSKDKNKMWIRYTTYSAGKDKIFDTDDDLEMRKIDFNKTRGIMKWAGERFRQGVEGAVEGFHKKNKFDE